MDHKRRDDRTSPVRDDRDGRDDVADLADAARRVAAPRADGRPQRRVPARGEGRAVEHDGHEAHKGDADAEDHDGPERVDVLARGGDAQQGPADARLDEGQAPGVGDLEEDQPWCRVSSGA